jgi:type II restriction/modification system DNA methylase subunit YeeA
MKNRTREIVWAEIEELMKEIKAIPPSYPAGFVPHVKPGSFEQFLPPREDVCIITRYFKDHPNEKSVMISCSCRYCAVTC